MLVRFGRSFSEKTAGILAVFRGFFPEKSAEDDWQMASNCQSYLLTDPNWALTEKWLLNVPLNVFRIQELELINSDLPGPLE